MKNSLLLLTRFVVAVSGVVNLILALIALLAPGLINTLHGPHRLNLFRRCGFASPSRLVLCSRLVRYMS